jgi:hypothetical protein
MEDLSRADTGINTGKNRVSKNLAPKRFLMIYLSDDISLKTVFLFELVIFRILPTYVQPA